MRHGSFLEIEGVVGFLPEIILTPQKDNKTLPTKLFESLGKGLQKKDLNIIFFNFK